MPKKTTTKTPAKAKKRKPSSNGQKMVRTSKGKLIPESQAKGLVKKGEVRNPAGRAKGSRNKFAAAFIEDFYKDWQEKGAEAVKQVREKDPAAYLRVGASLIPKEFTFKDNSDEAVDALLDKIDESELPDLIAGLIALGRQEDQAQDRQPTDQKETGSQSGSIH